MIYRITLIRVITFLPLLCLSACLSQFVSPDKTATNAKVVQPTTLQGIRPYVHVLPVRVKNDPNDKVPAPDSSTITRLLRNEIVSRHFVTLISSDTLTNDTSVVSADIQRVEIDSIQSSGAVILATMNYVREFARQKNAILLIELINPRTDSVLAYSSHDVKAGDARGISLYMSGDITTDAIKYAVDGLERVLKEAQWGNYK